MIRLEYFTPNDFEQLIGWINSEHLLTNWAGSLFKFPLNQSSLEWYIENSNDLHSSEAFIYKVIDENTGAVVGHISLGGISRKNKSARISRVLVAPEAQGRGLCKQMVRAVCKMGFEDLQLHRISLGVYDFNTSAIRCYLSAGFVKEGWHRDVLAVENGYWSLVEMAMLESDWKALTSGSGTK